MVSSFIRPSVCDLRLIVYINRGFDCIRRVYLGNNRYKSKVCLRNQCVPASNIEIARQALNSWTEPGNDTWKQPKCPGLWRYWRDAKHIYGSGFLYYILELIHYQLKLNFMDLSQFYANIFFYWMFYILVWNEDSDLKS